MGGTVTCVALSRFGLSQLPAVGPHQTASFQASSQLPHSNRFVKIPGEPLFPLNVLNFSGRSVLVRSAPHYIFLCPRIPLAPPFPTLFETFGGKTEMVCPYPATLCQPFPGSSKYVATEKGGTTLISDGKTYKKIDYHCHDLAPDVTYFGTSCQNTVDILQAIKFP